MTLTRTKPSRRENRALARARRILSRVEQLDTCGCWDFENTRNREHAALRLMIDLLEGPYLTPAGIRCLEERIGWSEDWIDDAEPDESGEATP